MIAAIIAKKKALEGIENMNRRDIDALMAGWADDGVLHYPGRVSASGVFKGKEAIRKWYENTFQQFPQLKADAQHVMVENIWDLTGNNTIAVNYEITATNIQGAVNQSSAINMLTIRNGKIVEGRTFIFGSKDEKDALAARRESDEKQAVTECPWDKDKK